MFGFCATIISALLWPDLLSNQQAIIVTFVAFILIRIAPMVAGSLLACAWISIYCSLLFQVGAAFSANETEQMQQSVTVRGEIISLVALNRDQIRVDIELINTDAILPIPKRLRLTWKTQLVPQLGQQWQFVIKPKSITQVLNQGGFNQQKYFISQHIIGKGWVLDATLINTDIPWRVSLITRLTDVLVGLEQGDLLLAIISGDKILISSSRWQQLRSSGTGHLIAISGLHLSVVALYCAAFSLWLLTHIHPVQSRVNLRLVSLFCLISVCGYAALAGWQLPTIRAFVMLFLVVFLSFTQAHSSTWERLLIALFVVLVLDPVAILSAGLWLSFGALVIIFAMLNRQVLATTLAQKIIALIVVQISLTLVLSLLQMSLFAGVAPHALWMNLLMVPWFSLVVIPISLVSFLIWLVAANWFYVDGIFELANALLWPFVELIKLTYQLPYAWIAVSQQLLPNLLWVLLAILVLFCAAKRFKVLALLLLLPVTLSLFKPRQESSWQVHVLDVGQGLAVVIEKNQRVILYDTGASYGDYFSYAERVIIPFLQSRALSQVDMLILSHSDNDHAGGAKVILNQYHPSVVLTDVEKYRGRVCRPHVRRWQGLTLSFMGPKVPRAGNNGSCVVKVSDGLHQVLLTGDIEKSAEKRLIKQAYSLSADVLIAPHHGSNTSSTQAFINKVRPTQVIFAAGFNNRWRFPKAPVVARYQTMTEQLFQTGKAGQVTVKIRNNRLQLLQYRQHIAPFWYNQTFRFGVFANPE